jgi:hypothetical protein
VVCGKATGFNHIGETSIGEVGAICPWCIASGRAARELALTFVELNEIEDQNLPKETVEELTQRTPSYPTWQTKEWKCHCGDACEFHGDLSEEEALSPDPVAIANLLKDEPYGISPANWMDFARKYKPADPSVFKFICRKCGVVIYELDIP